MELILFYLFGSLAIVSGIMVIKSQNPIHSVLFLITVFCNATGLLLLLNIEFMAMIFIVVYVGAIAVLFLFVVMMLNIKLTESTESTLKYIPIGGLIGLIFLSEICLMIQSEFLPSYLNLNYNWLSPELTNIESIGYVFYTYYTMFFLLAAMILLVAMIGAITLTMQHSQNVKRQQIFQQLSRDFNKATFLVS